jgi:hypothetical protein
MNDFLNKLGAVTRHAANAVGTELNIVAHEQRVREAYQALGKLYYNYVSSGVLPEGDAFDEKVAVITEELKRIKELRDQKAAD